MFDLPITNVESREEIIFLAEDQLFRSGEIMTPEEDDHFFNLLDMMQSKKQPRVQISRIKHCESMNEIEIPLKQQECYQCKIWQRWASKQQIFLIELQTNLVQKELCFSKYAHKMQKQLQNKNKMIKEFQRIVTDLQQKTQQACQKQYQKYQMSRQQAYQHIFTTPKKMDMDFGAMTKFSSSTVLQEHCPEETINKWQKYNLNLNKDTTKKSTAGNKFGWSTAAPTAQKNQFQLLTHKFPANMDRCIFENSILKEYNKTLLLKIKAGNFRKLKQ